MKLWIKISSENRQQGAWFFDLQFARRCAKRWEMLIPVEIDLPDNEDDGDHSHSGDLSGQLITDIMDACYRKGCQDGIRKSLELAKP